MLATYHGVTNRYCKHGDTYSIQVSKLGELAYQVSVTQSPDNPVFDYGLKSEIADDWGSKVAEMVDYLPDNSEVKVYTHDKQKPSDTDRLIQAFAINAEIEGMKAQNLSNQLGGYPDITYREGDFEMKAEELKKLLK